MKQTEERLSHSLYILGCNHRKDFQNVCLQEKGMHANMIIKITN